MPFNANYESMRSSYHISEVDADGVSKPYKFRIISGFAEDIKLTESVSRLVLLALNMEGGIDRATELLRAETVKQRA